MVRRDWILASYPSGRMGPRDFSRSDRPWRSDGMSQTGRTVGRRERPFRVNRDDRDFGGLGGTWGLARAVLDWSSHRHPRRTRRRTPDPPHSWGGITYIVKGIVLIVFVGVPTMFFRFSDGGNRLFGVNLCCSKAVLQAHATWHILSAFMVLIAYDFCAQFSGDGRIFSCASPGTENF